MNLCGLYEVFPRGTREFSNRRTGGVVGTSTPLSFLARSSVASFRRM